MTNNKHNEFMKIYKMALSFVLNNAEFHAILNSTLSKPCFFCFSFASMHYYIKVYFQ